MTSTNVITTTELPTTTFTTTTTTTAFVKPRKQNKKKRKNRKPGKNIDYSTYFDLNTENLALDDATSPKSPNDNKSIFSMGRSQGKGQDNGIHPNTRKIAGMLRKRLIINDSN